MTTGSLQGKVAIVTGASRGIGADIAAVFAKAGMKVVAAARTVNEGDFRVPGSLSTTVEAINASGGQAIAVKCDLSREDEIEALWQAALDAYGAVDVVVNNAGILVPGTIEKMSWRHFQLNFTVNVAAPAYLSRLAIPHMRERGGGAIINISSGASRGPGAGPYKAAINNGTPYGLSKAALERMTQGMAAELCEDNISVNTLSPSTQIWVGGTVYVAQTQRPDFDKIDLTGKRKDGVIMGDACLAIAAADHRVITGRLFNDESALREVAGVTDFSKYPVY